MDPLTEYYLRQSGRGGRGPEVGPMYRASFGRQNGRGCGVGRVLAAAATPVIARGLQVVGEEAAKASIGFMSDVRAGARSLSGVRSAAISRISEATRNVKRRARKILTGGGKKKGSSKRKKNKKKGKRKTTTKRSSKRSIKLKRKRASSQKQARRRGRRSQARGVSSSSTSPVDVFF